jgi:hypothetical protein
MFVFQLNTQMTLHSEPKEGTVTKDSEDKGQDKVSKDQRIKGPEDQTTRGMGMSKGS